MGQDHRTERIKSVAGIAPDQPFWCIGDIHGRADLLQIALDALLPAGEPIVLLGDYINKGPQTAGVLDLLIHHHANPQLVPLRGNHEELFLRFLKQPRRKARNFLIAGGHATFDSFGYSNVTAQSHIRRYAEVRNAILEKQPDVVAWLESCPFVWTSGNVCALHAGADPRHPISAQTPKSFAWGHPQFDTKNRTDGLWVVHGHKPVADVDIGHGRIAINTCFDATGPLSAVRLSENQITIRQFSA